MKTLIEIQEEQRKLEEEKQRKQQQTQAKVNWHLFTIKSMFEWKKKNYFSFTKYN